jgi:hypothetical protein
LPVGRDREAEYKLPASLPESSFAFGGRWRVERERLVAAGKGATLRLRFRASKVHLVLGGRGRVDAELGRRMRTVRVTRDRLYTLIALPRVRDGLLTLRFTPGVAAYAFTFGADMPADGLRLGRRPLARGRLGGPVISRDRSFAPA